LGPCLTIGHGLINKTIVTLNTARASLSKAWVIVEDVSGCQIWPLSLWTTETKQCAAVRPPRAHCAGLSQPMSCHAMLRYRWRPLHFRERHMHAVLAKTLGGLSPSYYFRHFIFGLGVTAFVYAMVTHDGRQPGLASIAILVMNTFLYPYSRFVYERVVAFLVGENVIIANAVLFLAVKLTTMMLCWALAVCIAPIGLVYLYFYHSRVRP